MRATLGMAVLLCCLGAVHAADDGKSGPKAEAQTETKKNDAKKENSAEPETGFTPMFNGKDLSGWYMTAAMDEKSLAASLGPKSKESAEGQTEMLSKRFEWADGVMRANGKRGDQRGLFTTRSYRNYVLRLEYRSEEKTWFDSGVWNRCGFCGHLGQFNLCPQNRREPWSEFNRMEIVAAGELVVCKINGGDHPPCAPNFPASGPIGLQAEVGLIEYRNVRIREGATALSEALEKASPGSAKALFESKDEHPALPAVKQLLAVLGGELIGDAEAVDYLKRVDSSKAEELAALIDALKEPRARLGAAEALLTVDPKQPALVPALIAHVSDPLEKRRIFALGLLSKAGDGDANAFAAARAALKDADKSVRWAAALAVKKLGTPETTLEAVKEALSVERDLMLRSQFNTMIAKLQAPPEKKEAPSKKAEAEKKDPAKDAKKPDAEKNAEGEKKPEPERKSDAEKKA